MAAAPSFIPAKFQIPIVVVGSLLLIVLWGRLIGNSRGKPQPVGAIPDAVVAQAAIPEGAIAAPRTGIDEVLALLSRAAAESEDTRTRDTKPPPLARDPFAIPRPVLQQLLSDPEREGAETLSLGSRDNNESAALRQNALESLGLTATLFLGGRATAILGGEYLREGDEIEGFIVKAIHERSVIIEDSQGEETIRITEEPLP